MDESSESGHKWPEFRTKLKPLSAESLLDDGPYIFMDINHLEGERLEILEALPPPSGNPIYPSQEEAMALGFEFSRVARFAERPSVDALRQSLSLLDAMQSERVLYRLKEIGTTIRSAACEDWSRAATERTRRALAIQIRRVSKALDDAARCVDAHDSPATGAMLPTTFSRRVETLLGRGVLPLAWVRQLDVFRY